MVCHFLDIVATQIPTMVWDEGNKNLIFLILQIAGKSGIWTNYLTLSNFVVLKSVLVSTLVEYLSNFFIKFILLCSDYLLSSLLCLPIKVSIN